MARGGSKPQPTITPDSALGGTEIERSLRFNQDDSAYLSRSVGTTGNRRTFTISFWAKFCDPQADNSQRLFSTDGGNGNGDIFKIEFYGGAYSPRQLAFLDNNHAGSGIRFTVNRNIRDATSWYHVVFSIDTTQGTASDRVKIYINGEQESEFLSGSEHNHQPDQNYDTCVNLSGKTTTWGRSFAFSSSSAVYSDMYLAEVNLIDGQQLDPTYFGFTDPQTGIWLPKRYEGTYGTNGYRLDFSDKTSTTTLGIDKSPNGNDFTSNNFAVSDSVPDTPTNNWCTLNPLNSFGGTVSSLSNGLLQFNLSNNNHYPLSTLLIPETGKWYAEAVVTSLGNDQATWIVSNPELQQNSSGTSATNRHNAVNYYRTDLRVDDSDNQVEVTDGSQVNNIIGILIDRDEGTVAFKNNNSNVGNPVPLSAAAGSTETLIIGVGNGSGSQGPQGLFNFGQDSSFAGNKTAQGKTDASGLGDFYYEPPAGYRALCAKNIAGTSSPTVRPQKLFDTVLWTGNGGTSQTVTGLELKPDFVWIKGRSIDAWHRLQNSVVGANKLLYTNSNSAEATNEVNGYVSEFTKDGFKLADPDSNGGGVNSSGDTFVAWCWKAGGAAVANSDGNTASQVSVNTEAGFSIVTYTGTGSSTTIGHGLGKKPEMIFMKSRSATGDWAVLDKANTTAEYTFYLNDNNAYGSSSGYTFYADTPPTSSVWTVNSASAVNASGVTYVAYCWTSIPGYSKIDKYTGNGSDDGTYVYLGFRPAWVMVKRNNYSSNWSIYDNKRDPYNPVYGSLNANLNNAESTGSVRVDFLSDGFKHKNSDGGASGNISGGNYIYMAFAEEPGTTPFDTFPNAR